jgi:hypothetical protein
MVLICIAGVTGAADGQQAGAAPLPLQQTDEAVLAYQQTFQTSTAAAEANLETQSKAAGVVELLRHRLGDGYAGIWFDNEAGQFVVPLIPDAKRSTVAAAFAAMGVEPSAVRTDSVSSTWEELEEIQETVTENLVETASEAGDPAADLDLVKTSIDPRTNAVGVLESPEMDRSVEGAIEAAASRFGADIRVEKSHTSGPIQVECGLAQCGKPLRGGVRIDGLPVKADSCTVGLRAIGNEFGNRFVLTAGHCTRNQARMFSQDGAANEREIGSVAGTWAGVSGHDLGKINANGGYWDTNPWPAGVVIWHDYGATGSPVDPFRAISAEAPSYIGEFACHSGRYSGTTCGNIAKVNLDFSYEDPEEGPTVRENMSMLTGPNLCIEAGDSGGPVFAGSTALGITFAMESDLPMPCGNADYFSEITEDSDFLGVTVAPRIGAPPVVETGDLVNFEIRGGKVNGTVVRANGLPTTAFFQYGTTPSYGSTTSGIGVGSGMTSVSVEDTFKGLSGSTVYHFRLCASNASGTSCGSDKQFTTPDWRPIVATSDATEVKGHSAVLHGLVNPQGSSTQYSFEYGPTTAYGFAYPNPAAGVGDGTGNVFVNDFIGGLEEATIYHWRLRATNSDGTSYSGDRQFRTPGKPIINAEDPLYTNTFEPFAGGTISPNGAASVYQVEYGKTTSYGSKLFAAPRAIGTGLDFVNVGDYFEGLQRNTTYHYRIFAENEVGSRVSGDKSFTTLPLCKGPGGECVWSTRTTGNPVAPAKNQIESVSCASATMCMAVGNNTGKGKGFAQVWNGTAWSMLPLQPWIRELKSVSCPSTTLCMIVEKGTLQVWEASYHEYGGGLWYVESRLGPWPYWGTEVDPQGISCLSASDCTVVGSYVVEGGEVLGLGLHWNGSSWSHQAVTTPPGGARQAMHAVSCSSATSCVSVGQLGGGLVSPTASVWSGGAWAPTPAVPLPAGAVEGMLQSVSCTSSTNCLAVGSYREGTGGRKTLVEKWNGAQWSRMTSPNPSGKFNSELNGISCFGSGCIAVGQALDETTFIAKTLVESLSGSTWTIKSSPNPIGDGWSYLQSVSCTLGNACTAVGASRAEFVADNSTLAERWNGTAWSLQTTLNPNTATPDDQFEGVSCAATTMCMAVGSNTNSSKGFTQVWNGSEWSRLPLEPWNQQLRAISCPSTSACMVVNKASNGSWEMKWLESPGGFVWYSESRVPPLPAGATNFNLTSVSCSTATACTAVGSFSLGTQWETLALRWNGSSWSRQSTVNPASGNASQAMVGVSCPRPDFCMAVGAAGHEGFAERWDGFKWSPTTPVPMPAGSSEGGFQGVSCVSSSFCAAVGNYTDAAGVVKTLVETWNGSSWSISTSPNPAGTLALLSSVTCLSPRACTAAGLSVNPTTGVVKTLVEGLTKTTWTVQPSPSPSTVSVLNGVSCTSSIACVAVGSGRPGFAEAERTTIGEVWE